MTPPPPSPIAGALLAARFHLKTGLKGARAWLGPAVLLVPLGFTLLALARRADLPTEPARFFVEVIAKFTLFGGLALLLPLFYAGGAWSDEVDRKTITYLLLRPVPRASLYLGKVLSASLLVGALSCAVTALSEGLLGAAGAPVPDLGRHILGLALGAIAYGALFAFLGLLLPRFALLLSILYGALFEVAVPELGFSFQVIAVQHWVRLAANLTPGGDIAISALVLLGYSAALLAAGALLASRRDYAFGE
jgi:ABC-type transport system involved in multi-copper enzyme maturation permease subunit